MPQRFLWRHESRAVLGTAADHGWRGGGNARSVRRVVSSVIRIRVNVAFVVDAACIALVAISRVATSSGSRHRRSRRIHVVILPFLLLVTHVRSIARGIRSLFPLSENRAEELASTFRPDRGGDPVAVLTTFCAE